MKVCTSTGWGLATIFRVKKASPSTHPPLHTLFMLRSQETDGQHMELGPWWELVGGVAAALGK